MPALEALYLEAIPIGHTLKTMDPVYNHGHQVKASHAHFKKSYESRDLLGKVYMYLVICISLDELCNIFHPYTRGYVL